MSLLPSKRSLRAISIVATLAVVLAFLAAVLLIALLHKTVPNPSGAIAIPTLGGPVEVVRDREGVPHIFAANIDDLGTALGFTHAQDRLWQMELVRRAGQGRLSEIFGERTLHSDIFLRTLDLRGHAERSLKALSSETKALLGACARGQRIYRSDHEFPIAGPAT